MIMQRIRLGFVELLWFGRPSSIIAQTLVASVPIIISLLAQRTPNFFMNYREQQLILLLVVVGMITICINFWLLSKAGASTYSPLLHTPTYLFKSVVLNLLVAGMVVYVGYLILLYPETRRIIPTLNGLLAGTILSSVYSVLLVGANTTVILSRAKRERKDRLIEEFLSECEQLEGSATEAIDADTDAVEDAVSALITELSNEPMHDSSEVEQQLSNWHTSFQRYNTGGQRKMVGAGIESSSELETTWASLYEQYRFLRKQLSDMQTSALSSITNG